MTSVDRIQGLSGSLAVKAPVRVATTAAITLAGEQTIDGVAGVTGDRVLVKDQVTPVDNGIWIVSTGYWTRAPDFDGTNDCVQGTLVVVANGAIHGGTTWRLTTVGVTRPGTSSLAFEQSTFSGASSVSFLQAGTGAIARTVQHKLRPWFDLKDFGAIGDGATNDTAAVSAANAASAGTVSVPEGTYLTTLAASALTKTYTGPGSITLTGGQKLPNNFTYTSAAPASWSTPGNPAAAFSGVSKSPLRSQAYVVGAATASTPATGYFQAWDVSQVQNNIYITAGHNESTSGAVGRTMISQQYNYTIMAGQGDASGYLASGYISNPTPTASSHWLADPAITALAGGYEATTNSVNIVGVELGCVDNGHETTMSGFTSHITRTVQPSPNTKAYVCVNFGATSVGATPLDAFYYGAGKSKIGIDWTAADFSSSGGAAMVMKADQYIYGNGANTSVCSTPEGTAIGYVYTGYQSASSAWVCVNGSASWRLNTYGFVLPTVPLYTQAGRVKGVRVVTASGAVTTSVNDEVIIINKSSGAATAIALFPTPATGTEITIKDGKGDANTNNITVTPNAGTIDGAATSVINTAYGVRRFVYNGTQWNVL